ncbi:MAG TPA: protein kinase, partial [Rhodopila sp.]|nr:protein kinase [Rhodopila sp.]
MLARTPTSVVYDGWDSDIARRVAIKTVRLSSLEDEDTREALVRFKRGVQAAGKLAHPNVINIYDYGETDEYAYIVMEFIDGPTLKHVLDSGKRFDLPAICRIMGGILDGLQYSHDHGVVHRDMKPANIMFTHDDRVKITDFGIARLEDTNLTQAGMVIGTPAYMSPEQFLGEDVDWRADIYATGVVLYHMLTGSRPYDGNLATIMNKVLNAPIPRPSVVSPVVTSALDQIVTRAMAKKKEHRFQSAAEFNAALQAALTDPSPAARPGLSPRPSLAPRPSPGPRIDIPLSPRPTRRPASRGWPVLAGILLLLAGIAAVGLRLAGIFTPSPVTVADVKPAAPAPEPPRPAPTLPTPAPSPLPPPAQDQALGSPPPVGGMQPGDVPPGDTPPDNSAPVAPLPPLELDHNDMAATPQPDLMPRPAPGPARRPDISPQRKAVEVAPRPLPPEPPKPPRRPGSDYATTDDPAGRFMKPPPVPVRPPNPPLQATEPAAPPAPTYAVTSTSPIGLLCQSVTPDSARAV